VTCCDSATSNLVNSKNGGHMTAGIPMHPQTGHACDVCGWRPARPVTYRTVTGIIFWWRVRRLTSNLCRDCGRAAFHECQSLTMARGWWGLLAPLVSLWVLVSNYLTWRSLRALPAPNERSGESAAPLPAPLITVPLWERPLALIGTTVALAVVALIGLSLYNSRPVSRDDSGSVTASGSESVVSLQVGDCLGDPPPDGQISNLPLVPCDEPHYGEVYAEFTSTNSTFSDASLSSEAERLCAEAFSPFVGTSVERSNYTIALLVPIASGWARGDREITCIATRVDGSVTVGSAKGSRA